MHKQIIEFNLSQRATDHPEIRTGDVVRVHRKIKEGDKERIQIFEGLVIRIQGRQSSSPMLTIRKQSFGVGVEIMIPLYSPVVEKIEVVKKTKTRRARLYFVREKTDRALRKKLRATTLSGSDIRSTGDVLESEVSTEIPEEEQVAVDGQEKTTSETKEELSKSHSDTQEEVLTSPSPKKEKEEKK